MGACYRTTLRATTFGGRLSEPPFVKSWIRPSCGDTGAWTGRYSLSSKPAGDLWSGFHNWDEFNPETVNICLVLILLHISWIYFIVWLSPFLCPHHTECAMEFPLTFGKEKKLVFLPFLLVTESLWIYFRKARHVCNDYHFGTWCHFVSLRLGHPRSYIRRHRITDIHVAG